MPTEYNNKSITPKPLFTVIAKESKDSLERTEAALQLAKELDEDAERELVDKAITIARKTKTE